jgi:anti-sigma B factor antagonist
VDIDEPSVVSPPDFRADVAMSTPSSTVIVLHGELDVATAPMLAETFDEVCLTNPRGLVLDLAKVSFCDSSGIAVLVRTAERCEKTGTSFELVGVSATILRTFELVGVSEILGLAAERPSLPRVPIDRQTEAAVKLIAEQVGWSDEEALERLTARAKEHQYRVHDYARLVNDGIVRFGE